MSEEYSIIEQARDARKVSWVCLHCGCSVEEAAMNVLDKPERFIAEFIIPPHLVLYQANFSRIQ